MSNNTYIYSLSNITVEYHVRKHSLGEQGVFEVEIRAYNKVLFHASQKFHIAEAEKLADRVNKKIRALFISNFDINEDKWEEDLKYIDTDQEDWEGMAETINMAFIHSQQFQDCINDILSEFAISASDIERMYANACVW